MPGHWVEVCVAVQEVQADAGRLGGGGGMATSTGWPDAGQLGGGVATPAVWPDAGQLGGGFA